MELHDLLVQSDLLGLGPGVVEENVAVCEKVNVVVTGVPALRSRGVVSPKDFTHRIADRENVFSIGGAYQDQAIFSGVSEGREREAQRGDDGECGSHVGGA